MKYLIAVDGSQASESAVKYAATLFKNMKGDNHITVMTVQDDSSLSSLKNTRKKAPWMTTFGKTPIPTLPGPLDFSTKPTWLTTWPSNLGTHARKFSRKPKQAALT